MIKRLTPILFLLVYTCSIVGSTIERTQALVAERSHDSQRGGGHPPARITEWHRRPVCQPSQTKILEDGSFVVSPFLRTNPLRCEMALQHFTVGFIAGQSAQVFPSRAPPAALV
jgi:hypothetical protein